MLSFESFDGIVSLTSDSVEQLPLLLLLAMAGKDYLRQRLQDYLRCPTRQCERIAMTA